MNILEALKKYIRANGGSSKANNISEAVKDLNSVPRGQGGGMVVNITFDQETEIFSCNKTFEEIATAYPNIIFVDPENSTGSFDLHLDENSIFYASRLTPSTSITESGEVLAGVSVEQFTIDSDNIVGFNATTYLIE